MLLKNYIIKYVQAAVIPTKEEFYFLLIVGFVVLTRYIKIAKGIPREIPFLINIF